MLNEATLCQLEARAERVANRPRPNPLVKRPDQYPTNPIGYCHDILGVTTLTQPQQEILHHLTVLPRRVLVPSAHDVGKTFVAACAACWWFDQFNPGLVLTTAPTERDVIDLLWTEIRSLWQRAGQERPFVGPKAPEVYDGPTHYAKGYVSRLGQGFQGRHQPHMLFIKDEANDIPGLQWVATRTMFDPALGHSELAIFNPVSATSHAYLEDCACDEPGGELRWHRIRLSALDHPNIQHEYATGRKLIRGAVGVDMLEAWVNDWTDPVQPGDERPTDIVWPPERPCPCCRRKE